MWRLFTTMLATLPFTSVFPARAPRDSPDKGTAALAGAAVRAGFTPPTSLQEGVLLPSRYQYTRFPAPLHATRGFLGGVGPRELGAVSSVLPEGQAATFILLDLQSSPPIVFIASARHVLPHHQAPSSKLLSKSEMLLAISSDASRMTPIQREGPSAPPGASLIDRSSGPPAEIAASASSTSQALVIAIKGVLSSWEAERTNLLSRSRASITGRNDRVVAKATTAVAHSTAAAPEAMQRRASETTYSPWGVTSRNVYKRAPVEAASTAETLPSETITAPS